MKNGYIELSDADTLMNIYKKIDGEGNLKDPLTTKEQVLIFCIAHSIREGKIISGIDEFNRMQKYFHLAKKHDTIGKIIDSCAKYEEIGTVEEFREARERRIARKPTKFDNCGNKSASIRCPNCFEIVSGKYCENCGQAIL